ncbi:hypothetical protein [Chitinophaga filiformis]|uniref:MoxR-vWA-beta-propeller ternary system domain-containing protein n=1 Tax=Chitinophaga filiformis TaxID=104663 RepID=A0A1G8D0S3_CHIFI|nr:hypothetical protein [Chitinophaga filiformis]SDH50770.1 hypothetical protein SAMN04488121_11391 [Chitinophaga filiformis]
MEVQLSYNPQTRHKTGAAFLRGNSPEQWFREINDWQISLKGVTCFVLPEHTNTVTPGGLLVIFSDQVPAAGKISHPYGIINGNLFMPVDATLMPALTPAEMRELLIWHAQVFHPAIGFVGFDMEDEHSLDSFLLPSQASEKSWNHAHPGMPPVAYLHTISVAIPPALELTDLLNDGHIPQPLSELPGKKPRRSLFMRFIDWMVRCFLRILLIMFNIVSFFLRSLPVKLAPYTEGRGSGRPIAGRAARSSQTGHPEEKKTSGLREKLRKWIEKTLGDIEERRDSELDRLLKMFDQDGDEALKYAIPLGDESLAGRGTAPQSATLSKKDANFNLGTLFSHQPVDAWATADSYTTLLSRKYEQMAAKALEEGDHRKAAYIYAHLLRNFHRAAIVLEEGKFYHEAAALYKDRLGQPLKAAECFEKGGLLLDAINIYKSLNKYEKTGDLYRQLSREKPAQQYFQLAVDAAMQQKNHLEAARILQHKSGKPEEACEVLLDGWQHGNQDKDCLPQYLDLAETIDEDGFPGKLRMIYEQKTPEHKKNHLVEIFLAFKKHMNEAAQDVAIEIAYEVISPQIAAGKEDRLAVLKKMLPDDKELSADIYRYSARKREVKPTVARTDQSFQLEQHINWLAATVIKKQLIFVGTSANVLFLLRMTPQGTRKYYSWQYQSIPDKNGQEEQFYPYISKNNASKSGCKLLHLPTSHNRRISLGKLILPSEKPFGDKVILDTTDYPANHMGGTIGMTINSGGDPLTVFSDWEKACVLIKETSSASYYCTYPDSTRLDIPKPEHPSALWGKGPFYFGLGNKIYRVNAVGKTEHLELPYQIRHVAATEINDGMLLMASTTHGCIYVVDKQNGLQFYSQYFGESTVIRASQFVSKTYLVQATNKETIVYNITTGVPTVKTRFNTAAPVRFILATGEQNEVALVDEKGRITVHQIDDRIPVYKL